MALKWILFIIQHTVLMWCESTHREFEMVDRLGPLKTKYLQNVNWYVCQIRNFPSVPFSAIVTTLWTSVQTQRLNLKWAKMTWSGMVVAAPFFTLWFLVFKYNSLLQISLYHIGVKHAPNWKMYFSHTITTRWSYVYMKLFEKKSVNI